MGEANEVFAVGKYKGEGANKLSNQDKEHFKEVFLRMEIIGKKIQEEQNIDILNKDRISLCTACLIIFLLAGWK